MKNIFRLIIAMVLLLGTLPVSKAAFSDVSDIYPYKDAIEYVQNAQMVTGYSDGTFKPDQTINRAEFTKIIVNAFYKDQVQDAYLCNVHYKEDVRMCEGAKNCEDSAFVNYGVCMGYASNADGSASSASGILKVYDSCFPDIAPEVWYRKFVCLAKMKGFIGGYPDGTFRPEQPVSFVESAKILSNAFGYAVTSDTIWYRPYVGSLADRKAIPQSISTFEQKISRGELAEMIYRLKEKVTNRDSKSYASLK